ncbi:MAG: NADH-quinone oxidoreductase subunit B [SAR324 cluster bacterium]|nr:NADH-quinone oxidoreductase subunit B [SAR324 cluster bacterium]
MGLVAQMDQISGGSFILTRMDEVINWARANSLWPLVFGTSCCAIEMMMATGAARHDLARFGAEVVRPSPRQADLLILAGTIVKRMAPRLRTLYEQMAEPRYVIATGACTISGGPFVYNSYTTIRGADQIIPVDIYVPGCPPRPESLLYGILALQKMIKSGESLREPGIRKKPVVSELPPGVKLEDITLELQQILGDEGKINIPDEIARREWPTGL